MIPSRRSARFAFVLVLLSMTGLVSCAGQQRVNDYGPEAKKNFVGDCTKNRDIVDGKQVVTSLATNSYCTCVYNGIANTYKLPWDDLTAYEEKVADAKPGELPPPPPQLDKAMADCAKAGPAAPAESSGGDATTTTPG